MTQRSTCVCIIVSVLQLAACADQSETSEPAVTQLTAALHHHHPAHDCAGSSAPRPPVIGWQAYDDGLSGAIVDSVMFDPRVASLAFAAVGDSVWQSTDSGASWHEQGTLDAGRVGQLAVSGDQPGVLLAASSSGLHRSLDAGATWSELALAGLPLTAIAVPLSQPLRVYVGVSEGGGVFRSNDGGQSFVHVGNGYPFGHTAALSVAPNDPDDIVAGIRLIGAAGGFIEDGVIVRSVDAGATWTTVLTGAGFVTSVDRCASNPDVLLAGTQRGVAKSVDHGMSWSVLPVDGEQTSISGVALGSQSCDEFYALQARVGPRHTTDGGRSFGPALTRGLQLLPVDQFPAGMALDPRDPSRALLATHGGIYTSTDAATTWSLVPGLLTMAVRSLSTSPLDPGRLWLASWGSGVWTRAAPAAAWERIPNSALPSDFSTLVAADPGTPNRVFVGAQGSLYRSDDGQHFGLTSVTGNPVSATFDPSDTERLFIGTQNGIFKTLDGGSHWTRSDGALDPWTTPAGTFIDVRVLAIDPSVPATLYATTNGRGVFVSSDGGGSWRNILGASELVGCFVVVPVPNAASELYACVAGIQRSVDGGVTWSDVSAGLASLPVNDLLRDDISNTLYATTSSEVYARRASDSAWTSMKLRRGAHGIAIVTSASSRTLVVGAAGGVRAHAL